MLESIALVVFIATFVLLLFTINRVNALENRKSYDAEIELLLAKYPGIRSDVKTGDVIKFSRLNADFSARILHNGWLTPEYGTVRWDPEQMYFVAGQSNTKLDHMVRIIKVLHEKEDCIQPYLY